jgi:para-nitrobenzyl esterase
VLSPSTAPRLIALPVFLFAILLGSCAGAPEPAAVRDGPRPWNDGPVVVTRFGALRGRADEADTWSWKGIPYAAPPVGELRWRAPREPAPWAGVRDSSRFGSHAVQHVPVAGGITGSEDCLYLNVWRPRGTEAGLPVYVWIHGGGNSIGAADMVRDYYGHAVASASRVVFVSVNYRLGPLGWLALPALREGVSAEDDSGNFGTLDLVQALRWIRDNIEAFGGDPHTVMISGESAGGMNVLSLIASPLARGLFHRALVQSGISTTTGMAEAEERAGRMLADLLVRDRRARTSEDAGRVAAAMSPAEIRAYLRGTSARRILARYAGGIDDLMDNPSLLRDGTVLPREGYRVFETGAAASRVPVVIGSNADEIKLFEAFGGPLDWRGDAYQAATRYASDRWKAHSVDAVARRLSSHADQPPVFAYHFRWGALRDDGSSVLPGNWGRRLGAFHSLEVPFFLGTRTLNVAMGWVLFTRRNEPGRMALSAAMMAAIARFIRTGDPNGPGAPPWPAWSNGAGGPKSLVLDADARLPAISVSTLEVTLESAEAALRAAVGAAEVQSILAAPRMIRSDFDEQTRASAEP